MLPTLLGNTAAATALALAVLLVCRLFRPGPAVRHALWLVVVVKLLSPAGLVWSVPLPVAEPSFFAADEEAGSVAAETSSVPTPAAEVIGEWVVTDGDADPLPAAAAPIPASASGKSSAGGRGIPAAWLLLAWGAGAVVVAWRCWRRTTCFARLARRGRAAGPSLERQVAELAALLGVRCPRVRVLERLSSPVVWGLFRPALLWPKGLQDRLSAEGRRAVLVHELAHLRRRDHWVRWLELAAAVVHWWNPLFWLARRQLRFHAELACDAWVTGTLPGARRAYAEALLEVCARSARAAAPSPAVGAGGDGRRDFQRRLTMIMREKSPCRLAAWAKLGVVLLATAALPAWTLGQGQADPKPTPELKPAADAGLKHIDLDFDLETVKPFDVRTFTWQQVGASDDVKAIEAKIAELTKQLELLKERRAYEGQLKKAEDSLKMAEPLRFQVGQPIKARVLMLSPDGKVMEARDVELKGDVKAADPAQPIRVRIGGDPKNVPLIKVIGPDGKEIPNAKVIIGGAEVPAPAPRAKPVEGVRELKLWLGEAVPNDKPVLALPPAPKPHFASEEAAKQLEAARARLEVQLKKLHGAAESQPRHTVVQNYHVVEAIHAGGEKILTLTRATYHLPKDKAEQLVSFLKSVVKAPVLETKYENDALTVTTTPDVQGAIGPMVRLMEKSGGVPMRFEFRLANPGAEKK
jgi:beta-lactamase regulating signal transducer with metallopeptidase domain